MGVGSERAEGYMPNTEGHLWTQEDYKRHLGETIREAVYRGGLEKVRVRITSTCTPDPLRLLDIVTKALEEGLKDEVDE